MPGEIEKANPGAPVAGGWAGIEGGSVVGVEGFDLGGFEVDGIDKDSAGTSKNSNGSKISEGNISKKLLS